MEPFVIAFVFLYSTLRGLQGSLSSCPQTFCEYDALRGTNGALRVLKGISEVFGIEHRLKTADITLYKSLDWKPLSLLMN